MNKFNINDYCHPTVYDATYTRRIVDIIADDTVLVTINPETKEKEYIYSSDTSLLEPLLNLKPEDKFTDGKETFERFNGMCTLGCWKI